MIVVDGRTDEEKLVELLAGGAEEEALDFKSTLDLRARSSKATLDFVKDVVSMCNLPDGGYIVVGVDDNGLPAHDQTTLVLPDFDSAKLRAKVTPYVETPIRIVSQGHEIEGRAVVVIYVHPCADGLPVPMSSIGQYVDQTGGKPKNVVVFREGDVLIREGTSNVRLRYGHWPRLLARYRERIKAEARQDIDVLLRAVVEGLRTNSESSAGLHVPLDMRMEPLTLAHAVGAAMDAPTTIRVEQFLNTAVAEARGTDTATDLERWTQALDAITVVATQAAMYRRSDVFARAIDALQEVYAATAPSSDVGETRETAARSLDVDLRVFAIGSLVVRRKAWTLLPTLVLRPVRSRPHYVYGSWIRHASVRAARAGLLLSADGHDRGGQLISLAHSLVAQEPALRPDYAQDVTISPFEELADSDWLLNSMCEFDLWWCLVAAANRPVDSGIGATFNPSCAAFHQYRAQPALERVVGDATARSEAFLGKSDSAIADALAVVVQVAVHQSHQFGGWWEGLDELPEVRMFVENHGSGEAAPGY